MAPKEVPPPFKPSAIEGRVKARREQPRRRNAASDEPGVRLARRHESRHQPRVAAAQKELPSRLHFAAGGGARTKLV